MRLESYDLQKFARQTYELNAERIFGALPDSVYKNTKRVIAAGCGDSYCAAFSAKKAFEELVGLPYFGLPAIEVSRHFGAGDFDDTLFLGISSRGRTSRVLEAAKRINTLGKNATTVAIVNFKVQDSLLEKECDRSIHVEMPVFECGEYTEHAPCQRSYFSTMFTLITIAVKMGEVRGNYSHEEALGYMEKTIRYAERFDDALMDDIDDRMWQLAQQWEPFTRYEVVASGYEFANAWFGAAKVVEAFGDVATYENTGNWMYGCRYAKNPESVGTVVLLVRDNKAKAKTVEVIGEMVAIGRPVIVITDEAADCFPKGAHVFHIPTTECGFSKPLMQYAPLGNLLGYIAKMRGASFYRYGGENGFYIKKLQDVLGDAITEQPLVIVR